jgi:hypothetical protein
VGVGEEVADAAAGQRLVNALDVAALGQPNSLRAPAEVALEFAGMISSLPAS